MKSYGLGSLVILLICGGSVGYMLVFWNGFFI